MALGLVALSSVSAMAAAYTWTPTATGTFNWDEATSNWTSGFPNAVGDTANIALDILGAQTINLNQAITVGSLTFNDTGASGDSAVTIAAGTSGSLTFQVASGNATVTNSSGTTNILSGPMTIASATTFALGTVGATTGVNLSGNLSGSAAITKTGGTSTLTISGADNSAFTGNWVLSGASSASALSISSDGQLGGGNGTGTNDITLTNNNAITFTATMTLNANRNITVSSGGIYLKPSSGVTATIAGNIIGAGGVNVQAGGTGVTILSGTNTYTGSTGITSGVLRAGSTTAFGNNSAVVITNASTAKLDLNGFSNSIGSLSGAVTTTNGQVTLGSGTLTTGGDDTSTSYSGIISGSGGFTKVGTGTQTLSGASTYTGATTINGGTLALGAAERIANTSNLALGGGTLATAGFSETLGTLTLNSSSTFDFGSGTSALVFSDSHSIVWTGMLTLLNFDIGTDSLKFGSSSSTLTSGQLASILLAGYTASLDGSGFVSFAAIPEPSTYAAILGALVLIGVIVHRRRAG